MKSPLWYEAENVADPRCRNLDDQVEMRRKSKKLAECRLPEGFRLVTPTPRQVMLESQVRWVFVLAWSPYGKDLYFHAQRYEPTVPDECQIQWAIGDFHRELLDAQVSLCVTRKPLPMLRKAS